MMSVTIASTLFLALGAPTPTIVQSETVPPTGAKEPHQIIDEENVDVHRIEQIRRYEFTPGRIGTFSLEFVGDDLRHAMKNGRVIPRERIRWDALDRTIQFLDDSRTREFSVTLNNEKVESIRLGSMLRFQSEGPPPMLIGIYTNRVSPALASHLQVDPENSLIVTGVVEGTPAMDSGVELYDVIVSIDAQPEVSDARLKQVVRQKKKGETVALRLLRASQLIDLEVPVALASEIEVFAEPTIDLGGPTDRSISLELIHEKLANPTYMFDEMPNSGNNFEHRVIITPDLADLEAFGSIDLGFDEDSVNLFHSDTTNRPRGIFMTTDDNTQRLIIRIEQLEKEVKTLKALVEAANNREKN